jgi:hypothetical protein
MRVIFMALTVVLVTPAFAQNEVFPTQAVTVAPQSHEQFTITTGKERKPRVFDRNFFLLAGLATAATALDVATTSHCLSTYANCQEGNPLVGSNPSNAKLYGISFSILGAQMLASAWMRREMPHRKLWMIPPIVATAGHGIATVLNLRTIHQLGASQ